VVEFEGIVEGAPIALAVQAVPAFARWTAILWPQEITPLIPVTQSSDRTFSM
jgi:hypothetical protein